MRANPVRLVAVAGKAVDKTVMKSLRPFPGARLIHRVIHKDGKAANHNILCVVVAKEGQNHKIRVIRPVTKRLADSRVSYLSDRRVSKEQKVTTGTTRYGHIPR